MNKYKILVVDDEPDMLESFRKLFLRKAQFSLTLESSFEKATKLLEAEDFHILLADLKIGDKSGIDLCKIGLLHNPNLKVLIVSGYGTIEAGIEAVKSGATDFIEKPFTAKTLFDKIESVINFDLDDGGDNEIKNFYGIIYRSKQMQEVVNIIKKLSQSDVSVLIEGESGTGKELVARALHNMGSRKDESFVPVNCGAIPENLFESELFGHEKGAFTGALSAKPGILEFANKGTIFLDEITETPINVQVKLLRMLEDKKIRRLGGHNEIDLDIRIISATNRKPEDAIKGEMLREDLYFRLSNFTITIPPLRERREDILPIFYHYLSMVCNEHRQGRKNLSENAENAIVSYDWPGNVREIINIATKLVILCNKDNIYENDLPLPNVVAKNYLFKEIRDLKYPDAKNKLLENFNLDYLKYNLKKYNGNISQTANACGMDRRTIHRLIKKHGIVVK